MRSVSLGMKYRTRYKRIENHRSKVLLNHEHNIKRRDAENQKIVSFVNEFKEIISRENFTGNMGADEVMNITVESAGQFKEKILSSSEKICAACENYKPFSSGSEAYQTTTLLATLQYCVTEWTSRQNENRGA